MIADVVHGGDIYRVAREQGRPISKILDFSASINPLGLSSAIRRSLVGAVPRVVHYPEVNAYPLRKALAHAHDISEDHLVVGNGSAELISVLPRALECRHGLVIGPTFMEFERALKHAGARSSYVHATREQNYQPPIDKVCQILSKKNHSRHKRTHTTDIHATAVDIMFLCNPNSPTGQACSRREIHELLEIAQEAKVYVVVDEAFVDYCAHRSIFKDVKKYTHLIVLRSFTKFYALPGIRAGYLIGSPDVVNAVQSLLPPWSVNTLAQDAAHAALLDTDFRRRSLEFMKQERKRFTQRLSRVAGIRVYPSSANFVMVEIPSECHVPRVETYLGNNGILVRDCRNFAGIYVPTIRLAVRRPKENDRLVNALECALK